MTIAAIVHKSQLANGPRGKGLVDKTIVRAVLVMAGLFCGVAVAGGHEIVLAERGKAAAFTIVIPKTARASVKYAAEELRDYVRGMTEVELPVVADHGNDAKKAIYIAPDTSRLSSHVSRPSFKDDDSFRIYADRGNLYVTGGKRGVLYGVYELLETYGGVGWFSSWRTVVPKRDRFAVPANLDDAQSPAFAMRSTSWWDVRAHSPTNVQNVAFAAHLRLNGDRNIPRGEAGEKYGGAPYFFGGGLGACHTFNSLLPPKKYFRDHPEWFSEVKGKRTDVRTQLCLTNPDVLRMVTSNVLERIRRDPDAPFYGVSQNDWRGYCECTNCAAVDAEEESHAGTMVRFVNAIAEAVEKEFPDKFIETLAYQYTRKPPKITKLRHNVIPCLCTIECEFNRPFGVSTNAANVSFESDIKGWSSQTRNLYLWDYTTDFAEYLNVLPNVYTLGPNLRFFRDNGVKYVYEQGCGQGRHADFAELKAWLIAKFEWNPDQPVEPLLDRFFEGYYGAAAPYVRQYFEEAQALGRRAEAGYWGIYTDAGNRQKVPDDFLVRATNLWVKAAAAVKDDPVLSYNVRMGAASPLYVIAARSCADIRAWVARDLSRYDIDGARRMVKELYDCKAAAGGNVRWIENGSRFAFRDNGWRNFLAKPYPFTPQDKALVPAKDLMPNSLNILKGKFVKDKSAMFGSALMLNPSHYGWTARLDTKRIAYDPGAKYRVRVHVKVDKKPGGKGEAFWTGVWDNVRRKNCGSISVKAQNVKDGWQWYDVLTWKPEEGQYFWLGPGRFTGTESSAHSGVFVDAIEISRCE